MKNDSVNLINFIKDENNPLVVANKISYFISDALREGKISLYEAYMLHWEEIRFKRMGYIQSGWNGKVRVSTCLAILNQKLLAHVFEEHTGAEKLKEWGLEAFNLNNEKRAHYIIDRYNIFLDANDSPGLLEELQKVRSHYEDLSDDGPYHNEVFPYHFYSPEKILLENNNLTAYEKKLEEDIENLIVELTIK